MKFELSDKTSKFAKRTLADFSERMIVMLADMSLEERKHYKQSDFCLAVRKRRLIKNDFVFQCNRKLTLEQYREPQMAQLYQNYLASGPLTYMEALFSGMLGDAEKARQTALDFYGPIFLLYSIYDGAEEKSHVIKLLEEHMDHFLQEMQIR